jgi:SsrA-binding protein|tara:strand:+ start:654 stop:1130 length:477 start_codon:yes stop_codon:yes gene_type:complete
MSKKQKKSPNNIASNKKARHDYSIMQTFEAGIALEGWEVKSIRAGKAQLKESYVILKNSEAWLIGAHISPLSSASTHITADPTRTRKLLLHKKELNTLIGAVQKKGLTAVALDMHWKSHLIKLNIALAQGKKLHDKRASAKDKDWQRTKSRTLKNESK